MLWLKTSAFSIFLVFAGSNLWLIFREGMHSVLTINGGSSSIKFALYQAGGPLKRGLYGKVDRIGLSGTNLAFKNPAGNQQDSRNLAASDHKSAANSLIDWLEKQNGFEIVRAVGHRVVHGMKHTEPEIVTRELLDELHRLRPYDPDHLPREIELIETFRQRHPKLPQVACFDTAFHQTMPRVASLLPIPLNVSQRRSRSFATIGVALMVEEAFSSNQVDTAFATFRRPLTLPRKGFWRILGFQSGGSAIDADEGPVEMWKKVRQPNSGRWSQRPRLPRPLLTHSAVRQNASHRSCLVVASGKSSLDRGIDRSLSYRMHTVTISPKFQVVIPQAVRETMGLRTGRKRMLSPSSATGLKIIPLRDIVKLRGYLKGIDTSFLREGDRVSELV